MSSSAHLGVVLAFSVSACATVSPGSRPDDMSAAEHRATAERHAAEAAKSDALFDPAAKATRSPDEREDFGAYEEVYNPTKVNLEIAEKHREHSRQHRAAATALETFEKQECRGFSTPVRASCPLLGVVERVNNIEGGVRLLLSDGVNTRAAADHMRCHYAFGRTRGRHGMSGCPLYLGDLEISVSGKRSIDVIAKDPAIVEQLRTRSATLVSTR